METERVTLPSGGWWEIKTALTRGDRRRIDRHVQERALEQVAALKAKGIDAMKEFAGVQAPTTGPGQDEEDMTLAVGTVAWGFGLVTPPLPLEAIYERSDADCQAVWTRMRELYRLLSEGQRTALKNG